MKYIDTERLKAEIERLEHENCMNGGEHFCMRRAICLGNLRNIITPLYHEQPEPEVDLEKEIHRYFNPHGMELQFDRSKGNTILKPEQLIKFARHFYELGKASRKED